MPKNVTFNLGNASGLATRTLVITRRHNAGDGTSAPSATHNADAGAVAQVTVSGLADNQMWVARLTDVLSTGETLPVQQIGFHTGSLQHLGPKATQPAGSQFYVLHMEDESSSSSLSSSSASSASSSSSASSGSSASSASSVSTSSVSTSSSSVSTSSSSASSASSASSVSSSSASSASSVSSSSASSSSVSSSSSGSSGLG